MKNQILIFFAMIILMAIATYALDVYPEVETAGVSLSYVNLTANYYNGSTWNETSGPYLYNTTYIIYFNETYLNNTIDDRASNNASFNQTLTDGLYYLNSNPNAYYNSSNFSINDYANTTYVNSIGNWTADKILYATVIFVNSIGNWTADKILYTTKVYVDSLGNWTADKSGYVNTTYADSLGNWTANFSSYNTTTNVNTAINNANTTMKVYVDANYYKNSNPNAYYNSTNFSIANYYLNSNPNKYYNSSNFSINDYANLTYVNSLGNWTANISLYVPYTGATANVNLGIHNITLNGSIMFEERSGIQNLFYVNPVDGDGFTMQYNYDFELANDDWLVFMKTDGNDARPDGGIAFSMSNSTGWNRSILKLDGYGLANFTDYNILTTGNVTAAYYNGNGSLLTDVANISYVDFTNSSMKNYTDSTNTSMKTYVDNNYYKNSNPNAYYNSSNFTIGNYYLNSNPNGYLNSSYNATYAAKADYNFGANNFSGSGNFVTTGNSTAQYFFGNGSQLTDLPGGAMDYTNVAMINQSNIFDGNQTINNGYLFINGTIGTIDVSGAGTRLMWIPSIPAFRAGVVSADQWDSINIGINSFAVGEDTIASGDYGVAFGIRSEARGSNSVAIGQDTNASGTSTVAMGDGCIASGDSAVCMGHDTLAEGAKSIAFGEKTEAFGGYSSAFGNIANASGESSFAVGYGTEASGSGAVALGWNNNGDPSLGMFTAGTGTPDANYGQIALGYASNGNYLRAQGTGSVAIGQDVNALTNNNVLVFGRGFSYTEADSFSIGFGQQDYKFNTTDLDLKDNNAQTTGNFTGAYFKGSGSLLTGILMTNTSYATTTYADSLGNWTANFSSYNTTTNVNTAINNANTTMKVYVDNTFLPKTGGNLAGDLNMTGPSYNITNVSCIKFNNGASLCTA